MGAVIGAAIRVLLSSSVAKWLAWKTVIAFIMTTILGIVLYNVVSEVFGELLTFVQNQMSAVTGQGLSGAALEFTGLGAWFAQKLKVAEQVGLMVSFIVMKWGVVKIPFLKW